MNAGLGHYGLPICHKHKTFCTVHHNAEWSFFRCKELCHNRLVRIVTKFCV